MMGGIVGGSFISGFLFDVILYLVLSILIFVK